MDNRFIISTMVLVVVHVSAIIGISVGNEDFFLRLTPLNLLLGYILVFANRGKLDRSQLFWFLGLAVLGWSAEFMGVQTGFPFGNYSYGENLGPKVGGVPILIGCNWSMLVIAGADVMTFISRNKFVGAVGIVLLMLGLDVLMEESAPVFDFWTFTDGIAPIENYIGWFGVALILAGLYQWKSDGTKSPFSISYYVIQAAFFAFFYG